MREFFVENSMPELAARRRGQVPGEWSERWLGDCSG